MQALICRNFGGLADLVLEETAAPELGGGMLRIAVKACGVNFPDLLMIQGKYQVRPPLPFSPGAEVAGEVIEIGPGVDGFGIGQRVLALPGYGGMAEQVCAKARSVIPIPDGMPFDVAAAFLLTYGTAQHALKQRAKLCAGENLVVLGAAGGVGLAAVELGRLLGARVIAAASTAEKLDLALRHGATEGINYAVDPLKDRILELTGKGADVVYDPVGGDLFEPALRALAWRGRMLVIGFASGSIPQVPANLPLLKGTSIVGVFWGRFTQEEPEAHRENIRELMEFWANGDIRPHVSRHFPLSAGGEAIATLARREALGKIVVTI
ncbi:MAG: NADPH:quinone oxidoreductase family protein [Gammaproteobacteria bacterium]|nr:NADPH:quinone oxidoreductase family protein [Gammaproteobacteria bacterium]MDH4253863.1 NADPH:quinone oxidoreductase family protein [Gammaproteobacteria bacterium]MDH5309824.1 NADPH:quinone oxidoreductase family protein [Gammaproteobacteria bacterium]